MKILVLLASLVVLALAVYALRLWMRVRQQDQANTSRKAMAREDQLASVRLLCKSLLDGDLNLSEAAIRLKVMLDHLYPDGGGEQSCPDIYALYDATVHMPRGAARKALPRQEIRRLDAEREALEHRYRAAVLDEARRLQETFG